MNLSKVLEPQQAEKGQIYAPGIFYCFVPFKNRAFELLEVSEVVFMGNPI